MRTDRSTLVGIALVCFANLLLSILITRLFSATMFYHFTFLAVALAMFGIAASGVYVFLRSEQLLVDVPRALTRYARWFAAATVGFVVYATRFPIFAGGQVPDFSLIVVVKLVVLIVATAIPFFFAGAIVTLALTAFREDVGRVYFYDLVGAALAALLAGMVLQLFGGPTAVLVVACLALVASGLFQSGRTVHRWTPALVAAAVVVANMLVPVVKVGSVKWERKLTFERWNAFSRITVDKGLTIKIDAGAATHIEDLRSLQPGMADRQITALALHTWQRPPEQVLIIGPGGGRDVLFALAAGAKQVTAVEINPLIANAVMRDRFAEASGRLYFDPRVHLVIDEGRSFIRRADQAYDMIQASLVDTWAATAAGAFALTENTLYTVEAFEDYYAHLTDRGVVTMTRFYGERDGLGVSESQRLVVLAAGALQNIGVAPADTRKHMFFAVVGNEGTLIVKKTPFAADELQRLEQAAATAGCRVLLSPTTDGSSLLERYVDQGAWSSLVRDARDDLAPPTDDRPFFFFFTKFGDLFDLGGKKLYDPGVWILVSLGTVLTLGVLFIVLPLLVARRGGSMTEPRRAKLVTLTFFGVVGFGFMAIEIAFLQRFTLFLGHPTYSLMVVLFVLLLSTGIGARISERFQAARLGRSLLIAGLLLAAISAAYGFLLGDVLRALIGLTHSVRVLVTLGLVAPCGLLMGLMIPTAVRVLADARSALVPWGWGVNGAMSVIGTSLATLIAMYVGFTATFVVGATAYALAACLGAALPRLFARSAA